MDKLVQLLNEFDEGGNRRKVHWIGLGCEDRDTIGYKDKILSCEQDEIIAYLISKKYGFIKWLVDNDKIDESLRNAGVELYHTSYNMYEAILMLLSISDTPIEDLISYLK